MNGWKEIFVDGRKPYSRRWITGGRVSTFIAQLVIATVGAMLVGAVFVLIPAVLIATSTRNMSGGNFADHVVEQANIHIDK
jgi:hypothetical protein